MNILFVAFAIVTFSGCYTEFVIHDDPPTPVANGQIVTQQLPPVADPDIILIDDPAPVYVPVPDPVYIPPAYSNPVATTPPPSTTQRTSGVQRTNPQPVQTSPQNTNRTSGTTRRGGK